MKNVICLTICLFLLKFGYSQPTITVIKERKIDEMQNLVINIIKMNPHLIDKKSLFYFVYRPYEKLQENIFRFSYIGVIGSNFNLIEYTLENPMDLKYSIIPFDVKIKNYNKKDLKYKKIDRDEFEKILLFINTNCDTLVELEIREDNFSHTNLLIQYLIIYNEKNIKIYEGSLNTFSAPKVINPFILTYPYRLMLKQ